MLVVCYIIYKMHWFEFDRETCNGCGGLNTRECNCCGMNYYVMQGRKRIEIRMWWWNKVYTTHVYTHIISPWVYHGYICTNRWGNTRRERERERGVIKEASLMVCRKTFCFLLLHTNRHVKNENRNGNEVKDWDEDGRFTRREETLSSSYLCMVTLQVFFCSKKSSFLHFPWWLVFW